MYGTSETLRVVPYLGSHDDVIDDEVCKTTQAVWYCSSNRSKANL